MAHIHLSFEVAEEMCDRIAGGESLTSICRDTHMPTIQIVYKWKREHDWFARMYREARMDQAHTLVDQIVDIADDSSNDYVERETNKGTFTVLDDEHIRRSAIRITTRQWFAERIAPKYYGPKAELALSNPDGTAMTPTSIILVAATAADAEPVKQIEHDDDDR